MTTPSKRSMERGKELVKPCDTYCLRLSLTHQKNLEKAKEIVERWLIPVRFDRKGEPMNLVLERKEKKNLSNAIAQALDTLEKETIEKAVEEIQKLRGKYVMLSPTRVEVLFEAIQAIHKLSEKNE